MKELEFVLVFIEKTIKSDRNHKNSLDKIVFFGFT